MATVYKLAPDGATDLFNIKDLKKEAAGSDSVKGAISMAPGVEIIKVPNMLERIIAWIKSNWQLSLLAAFAIVLLWKRL